MGKGQGFLPLLLESRVFFLLLMELMKAQGFFLLMVEAQVLLSFDGEGPGCSSIGGLGFSYC